MRRQYVASIGVKFYAGIDERLEQPLIYQDLPVSVRGERILLFDGVADRGISLQYTSEYLTKYKGVQELAGEMFARLEQLGFSPAWIDNYLAD